MYSLPLVINMNYNNIYKLICQRGKEPRELNYVENHHIIPKCLGGNNEYDNMCILTAKEHYLAHYILTKIYPKNTKLMYAFGMMKNSNKYQIRMFSAKQYENMKKSYSNAMKLDNPMHDEQTKLKAIETRTKRYESGELVIRKLSDKERKDNSERWKGDNNPTRKNPENHNFKNNSYVEGKLCFNNGIKNKYFYPDEIIPTGYVKGMAPYKRTTKGQQSHHG